MHRWLRSPRDHPKLAHLLPRVRDERVRRLMTSRIFLYKVIAAFAVAISVLLMCTLLMVLAEVYGGALFRVLSLALAGFAALGGGSLVERAALNRELDRSPRTPCHRCGYSLDSLEGLSVKPVCPECGAKADSTLF